MSQVFNPKSSIVIKKDSKLYGWWEENEAIMEVKLGGSFKTNREAGEKLRQTRTGPLDLVKKQPLQQLGPLSKLKEKKRIYIR